MNLVWGTVQQKTKHLPISIIGVILSQAIECLSRNKNQYESLPPKKYLPHNFYKKGKELFYYTPNKNSPFLKFYYKVSPDLLTYKNFWSNLLSLK